MKSNKLKILISFIAIFVLGVGILFYYASSKLRPEEIKKMAIIQTQKVFPNSEVELENVDIDVGFNFKINLEKFKITAIKDGAKTPMLFVNQLVVKVPLWAILTSSGVIEIKLDTPELNYSEFSEGNNWTYAMGEKGQEPKKSEEGKDAKNGQTNEAVDIFGKSKLNLSLSDVAIKYSLRDNSNGKVSVSKFLVKGLNFESSSAFELKSNAKFVMKDGGVFAFDTLAIGQFNISDLIKNGSVTSNVNIKLSNVTKSGLDLKIPDIVTDIELLLKKEGELSGKTSTTFDGTNKISSQFKVGKDIELSNIFVDITLKEFSGLVGTESGIDLSKAKLQSKGNLKYTSDKKIIPNLNFSISPGIVINIDGISSSTTFAGEFKDSFFSGKSRTDLLEGSIVSVLASELNVNGPIDLKKLKPIDIRVTATGLKIPEKLIRSKLWEKKTPIEATEVKGEDANAKTTAAVKEDPSLPPASVNIEWNNINVGGEDFSGKGRIVTGQKTIAVDNLNFKFSKGSGKLSQTMQLSKVSSSSNFNFEITNLNLESFKSFLPPFVENFSGNFSGKVAGSATMFSDPKKLPSYDVTIITSATKGEIKKLNIGEYINPLLSNVPVVKDQMKDRQIKVDGNFESLNLKGRFTNDQYALNTFEFIGLDKKVQLNGQGDIYPIAGKNSSTVEVNFIDNTGKISEVLQKNTGTKILPMKLVGSGFALKPDYSFTINKLAKGAIKTKGEEKLKEVVEKNIDKIVPEKAKEKVKGLLKGLFKK